VSAISSETIREAVQRHADEILEWAMTLIRFPSENRPPGGEEGPLQEFIAEECRKQGWEVDVFAPDEVPGIEQHEAWLPGRDYSDNRKTVVARWRGTGGGKSVLFSGHGDVAPFEPDNWKVCRPYAPLIRDGRLYGRGAGDMKGGLAMAFWAMRVLQELGFEPQGDILFESVVDEEFASGNGTLAARLRGYNADLAVVGEASRLEVCPAGLGAFLGDLTVTGTPGMPYTGTAIPNPLRGMARVIELFDLWQAEWRAENYHPLFTAPGKELNVVLWRLDTTRPGEFTQLGIPMIAKLSWVVWGHPGMTEEAFYHRFRAFWEAHAATDPALTPFTMEITRDFHYVKPWETPVDDPGVQAVVQAYEQQLGERPGVGGAPFSGDLAVYGEVGGMPVVYLGPRSGELHGSNEWAEVGDLVSLTGVFAHLAADWCMRPH
jgi:acetylornithine deacetylase